MTEELIIYTNKQIYKRFLNSGLILGIVTCMLFVWLRSRFHNFLPLIITILFALCALGLLCFIGYNLYRITRTSPMAIINKNGIWIKQFGTIAWSNIESVDKPIVMGMALPAVGIQVKDEEELAKKASITGKLIIFEARILNTPTIVIDNTELQYDEIILFAQQFISQTE